MLEKTIYVETTVIGHLVGRLLEDPIVAGRQKATRDWWPMALTRDRLFVSKFVADECGAGDPDAAAERLEAIESLQFLSASTLADDLAAELISRFAIPATEPRDAAHVSLAAVNGIEYLVTWNFKHIANPSTRRLIDRVCIDCGYSPPIICTPNELLEI